MDKDKSQIIFRRLLLSKQFYLHGLQHSNDVGALNKMIAVHNFHNSIEIILKAIFLKYEIRGEKELNTNFEAMLNEIDKFDDFKKNKKKLPDREEIRTLNKVRNLVQHQAIEPESSTMDRCRLFTKIFLEKTFSEYFGLDFKEITSLSLISDKKLSKLLELAKKNLDQSNWNKAIILIKSAFEFSAYAISKLLPSKIQANKFSTFSKNTKELTQTFTELFDQIRNTNLYVAILATGVSLSDYKLFEERSPALAFAGGGTPYCYLKKEFNEEDARWAMDFVIDTIVKWQLQGLSPSVPEWAQIGYDEFIHDQMK